MKIPVILGCDGVLDNAAASITSVLPICKGLRPKSYLCFHTHCHVNIIYQQQ